MGSSWYKQYLIFLFLVVFNFEVGAQSIFAESFKNPQRNSVISLPSVTGVDQVLTVSGTQVVRNKDFDGGTAANNRRITLPKDTTTNLTALTRKQGNVFYDTTTNKIKFDTGSALEEVSSGATVSSPTVTRFTSGTGTYTLPAGVVWLDVLVVGAGGGGKGSNLDSGTALSTTNLSSGTDSLFIGSVSGTTMRGGGGGLASGGTFALGGGAGGTAAVSATSTVRTKRLVAGGAGGFGWYQGTSISVGAWGGIGGGTCIGPSTQGGGYGETGKAGGTNTGAGGSGAGLGNVPDDGRTGPGGGGGGCAQAIINNPSSLGTITYQVGAAGNGATGDTLVGGAGATGLIEITEYYAK
jgi:hypothetical protein